MLTEQNVAEGVAREEVEQRIQPRMEMMKGERRSDKQRRLVVGKVLLDRSKVPVERSREWLKGLERCLRCKGEPPGVPQVFVKVVIPRG